MGKLIEQGPHTARLASYSVVERTVRVEKGWINSLTIHGLLFEPIPIDPH